MSVIFFDFDDTLCLWKLHPAAKIEHEMKVKDVMDNLKVSGKQLFIVSTSTTLQKDVKEIGIDSFFDGIYAVEDASDKVSLIRNILKEKSLSPSDALYFDDDVDCIIAAREMGVKSICVSPRQGILPFFRDYNR